MLTERIKNILSFLARFALSFALLVFLFAKIDKEKTMATLKIADLKYLFSAAVIFFGINLILLWRWQVLIKALKLKVTLRHVIRYFFIGLFGNLFLPTAVGGDLIKILGLCRESPQKARVVASVIVDRLSGFAGMVLVSITAFVCGYALIEDKSIFVLILIMAAASFSAVAVLFNERIYEFGCRIFNGIPRLKKALMDVHYDIVLLNDCRKEGWKAVGLSCLAQGIFSFTFYLTAKGLHQDVSMIYFLIFVPMMCVASAFPSIGGLGVREAGAAYLFMKVGMDPGIAVSMSLINFLFMVVVGLLGGIVYVSTLYPRRIQYSPSDADIGAVQP